MTQSKTYKTLRHISGKLVNNYGLDILIGFILASIFILMVSFDARAQNVGVNNPNPNAKALLDLTANDKGLLIPRMTLSERQAMFPVADATAKGMLVYQTDFTQGFYYYDGAAWNSVANGDSGWGLTGNSGTNPVTNYMGSSDSVSVLFKSNNKEVMRMLPNQKVGFGTTTPGSGYSSVRLEVADETGANSDIAIRAAGGGLPQLILESSNGTLAAPATSGPGAWGGAIIGQVYDGSAFINTSAIVFGTEGINTPGNIGGDIRFHTNKSGPMGWEKMRITSIGNMGIGVNPLQRMDVAGNTNVMADSNYRIGNVRVLSTKGGNNLFTGANAGLLNQTGIWNTYIGTQAGYFNTTGSDNAFLGANAGYFNTTGSSNTFSGPGAGYKNTTGAFNSYYGRNSAFNATTGNYNTFMGFQTGLFTTTGSYNTYIGYNARGLAALNNSAAIGSNAFAGYDNSLVLGDTSIRVGIGNSYPDFPLSFQNKLGDKISLWGSTGYAFGLGIQPDLLQVYAGGASSDIAFGYGTSNAFTERMRIKGNGNVGINTTTPSANLHLNGTFRITNGSEGVGKVLTSDASGNATWQTMNAGAINAWGMNGNAGTNSFVNYIGTSDATDLMFRTNGIGRMVITSNGNVGIGVSPLINAKLNIFNSTGEGININGGNQYNGLSSYVSGIGFVNSALYGHNTGIGYGVQGLSTAASGFSIGVKGSSSTPTGIGVEGTATDASGINYGVKGGTTSPSGFSGHFTGGRFYVGGNAGFGTIAPLTQVEINGGLSIIADATLTANALTFSVTVGNRSYLRINSNSTPANRAISLSNGLRTGQILIIECIATGGLNGIRLADNPAANNTNLASFHDMYVNDVITLIWNGNDWLETGYSDN